MDLKRRSSEILHTCKGKSRSVRQRGAQVWVLLQKRTSHLTLRGNQEILKCSRFFSSGEPPSPIPGSCIGQRCTADPARYAATRRTES
jgi:hypothetical protein